MPFQHLITLKTTFVEIWCAFCLTCVNKRSGAKVAQSATMKRKTKQNGSSNKQKSTVHWIRWNRREKKKWQKNVIKCMFLLLCIVRQQHITVKPQYKKMYRTQAHSYNMHSCCWCNVINFINFHSVFCLAWTCRSTQSSRALVRPISAMNNVAQTIKWITSTSHRFHKRKPITKKGNTSSILSDFLLCIEVNKRREEKSPKHREKKKGCFWQMNENNRVAEHNSSFYSILHIFIFFLLSAVSLQKQFFFIFFCVFPSSSRSIHFDERYFDGFKGKLLLNINEVQSIYFIFVRLHNF